MHARALSKDVNAIWYVLKYVNKTILGKDKAYASLLFASNKRMFSMSQNLLTMLNIKRNHKEQGWTFQGTVDENTVEAFCLEENVALNDISKLKPQQKCFINILYFLEHGILDNHRNVCMRAQM